MEDNTVNQSESASNPTSSQATVERDNFGDAPEGPTTRGGQWAELFRLSLLTILGSLMIVSYVWVVNKFSSHRAQSDVVENSALMAAKQLAQITVQTASFGDVGLCDLPAGRDSAVGHNRPSAISIDRVYQTLRTDEQIAKQLQHPLFSKLVAQDGEQAKRIEQELSIALKQAVEPDAAQTSIEHASGNNSDNNVYRNVYRFISNDREVRQASSFEVHLSLGQAQTPLMERDCKAHAIVAQEFKPDDGKHAPYLVRVETSYDRKGKDGKTEIVHRSSVAVIASTNVEPPPCAFVINFPSGIPPTFRSAYDILFFKHWSENGEWQQAVGNTVPGGGSLAPLASPTGLLSSTTSVGDAMAVAVYDWLKAAGPSVDPDQAVALLKSSWDLAPLTVSSKKSEDLLGSPEYQAPVNSCLARDTGAREYSIMNQTAPGSTGQLALSHAFSVATGNDQVVNQPVFPQSALPLFVDRFGNCNLSGRDGFDRKLVVSFLRSVHDTNLAALSSIATAKALVATADAELNQLTKKMMIERQELASTTRLSLPNAGAPAKKSSSHESDSSKSLAELSQQSVATLNAILKADEREQLKFRRIHQLGLQAMTNATRVANSTFELGSHVFKACRNGIYKIDSPRSGFLIGTKTAFFPCATPLSDTDFAMLDSLPPSDEKDLSSGAAAVSPWLGTSLDAVYDVQNAFPKGLKFVIVEGRPFEQVVQNATPGYGAGMVVLDSRSICDASVKTGQHAQAYQQYAFANIGIPSGQLLYYCQNALQTGKDTKVSWSVLLRDLVASKSDGNGESPVGAPIPSQERNWCGLHGGDVCPGLACELQIRCPLPVLNDIVEDTYLKNPASNAQVPQIPAVPPDML